MRALAITLLAALALGGCMSGKAPAPGSSLRDCADCPELVVIPRGFFTMGSAASERMRGNEMRPLGPVHKVDIGKPFAAGKFEVTNKEFAAFVKATGHTTPDACQMLGVETVRGKTWRDPGYGRPPAADEPVVCVTWLDTKAYAAWLSRTTGKAYRLLTEAEWEYAAKAGAATPWPWGEDAQEICQYANVYDKAARADPAQPSEAAGSNVEQAECSDGYAMVAPVGKFKANAFGLYDMIGNVWEWTEDCSLNLYPAAPADGSAVQVSGACEKRAVRSAGWRTRLSRQLPVFRGRDPESTASSIFGFRIARDLN